MGRAVEKVKLQNAFDASKRVEVKAVVDTGATMVALPLEIVRQLGLRRFKQVGVRYANNHTARKDVYGVVAVEIQGRLGHFDVLGEEKASQPLIGQTVLEELDLVVNPKTRKVTPNPESPDMPMLEMLGFRVFHCAR
ncbi:MAG: clan AA aspartic protease [Planctomycetes bacterium]|nr:clan AA aspartic protease [Planctomycetota bacterium]MBM4080693.1 clan AA aspartic protease [Planctomycetota bacterium]